MTTLPLNPLNDPNPIVTVQVSTVLGPVPNGYQQMGALVSHGGTSIANQDCSMLSELSDLESLLIQADTIASISWTSNVVTVTTTNAHNLSIGTSTDILISGCVPAGYNGDYTCTITGTHAFTYPLNSNPGAETTLGTYQRMSAIELYAMAYTFFGQRRGQSVYVLELGENTAANAIAALQTWLENNPLSFYGYLCPRYFDTSLVAVTSLLAEYQNNEAMTYFWITTTIGSYTQYSRTQKCAILGVEAPTVSKSGTEFTLAAAFFWGIQFKATTVTRVAPMCYKYLYGVTTYPVRNNGPLLIALKANKVNYVRTGAEGGIFNNMIYPGVTADGNDYFNWWWTIDWVQITVNQNLSNAIINGSNNPLAPLYYDQDGINQLLAVNAQTMTSAGEFGMVNGPVVQTELTPSKLTEAIATGTFTGKCDCNAVPFIDYSIINPGDYATGEYDGLSILFIPARGFVHVLVSIVASQLVTV